MKRWLWWSALLAGVCAVPAAARAAGPAGPADTGSLGWLDWEAPAGCPDRADVYARAREAAGFAPELGRFQRVRGVIVASKDGYLLTLQFFEPPAQRSRTIRASNCGDLEGAAAVAIALALGTETPSPPPEEATPASPAAQESSEAVSSGGVPAAPQLGWSWSAAGLLDLQSLSQPSWGLGLGARVRWQALELGLFGVWIPQARHDLRSGESVEFGLGAAGPLACWRLRTTLSPAACAAFEIGKLSADGAGLSRNERQFSPWWLAPSLALELQQPLGSAWGLQLRAEGLRPLIRERYTVNGSEPVYESPGLVLRLYLGVGLSLD